MGIKKIIITTGKYQTKEISLLVSLDSNDKPIDIINLANTHVGEFHEASVEKVLADINSSILKLDNGQKAFIDNKTLNPDAYIIKHSDNKLVCQSDRFFVQITQDKKGSKPCSCGFVSHLPDRDSDFIDYYVNNFANSDYEIISDLPSIIERDMSVKAYVDEQISLWQLCDFTKILDKLMSKIVHLKNGANLIIEPTEAMTIIDVNSGKNYGKGNAFDTNIIAAKEIAYQIRLRNISGIIIVDFLKMSREQEGKLIDTIKEYCKTDISHVAIHKFTHLGLLEITRSRSFSGIIY